MSFSDYKSMVKGNTYSKKVNLYSTHLLKGKLPQLLKLDMELTERCNNNCIHCYINVPADNASVMENELSLKEIKEILTEAASLGCMRVRFTGGEPLLRDDFEDIYVFARKLGLMVLIFTNATLITPNLAKLLNHIPPLQPMEISIYGIEKESYEAVTRTPGSFRAAMQGITYLRENRVPFAIKGVLLPSNKNEIDDFESWGVSVSGMDQLPPVTILLDLRGRRDSEDKNRQILRLRLPPEKALQYLTRHPEDYLKGKNEFCSMYMRPFGDRLFSCGAGESGICVDAYGYLQPCMLLRHPEIVYSIKNNSIKEIITDFSQKIRKLKTNNPSYLSRCARCFLKGLCKQCPAKSFMENGTLDTPIEYLCEIAHLEAKYLGLLKENEKAWEINDWQKRILNVSRNISSVQ